MPGFPDTPYFFTYMPPLPFIEQFIQDAATRQQARADIWQAMKDSFLIVSVDLDTLVPLNDRDRVVDEFVQIIITRAQTYLPTGN